MDDCAECGGTGCENYGTLSSCDECDDWDKDTECFDKCKVCNGTGKEQAS